MFRLTRGLTAGLAAVALVLSGCGGSDDSGDSGSGPGVDADAKTITFGGWRQQSGATSVLDQLTQAAQAHIDKVNEEKINGWTIKWDIPDAANDPSKALQIVREQIEGDQVLGLFAGMGSAAHGPVIPYVAQTEVPYIAPQMSTDPYFCGTQYPAVFPYSVPVGPSAAQMVKYAYDNLDAKSFFVVYQDDQTGQPVHDQLPKFIETLDGASLAGEASFAATDTDMTGIGREIADADPDAVFWQGGQATQMIKGKEAALARGLSDATWLGPNTFADPASAELAPDVYEGMLFYLPATPSWETDDPAVKEYMEAMGEADLPVNALTAAGWATAETLFAAVEGATADGATPTRDGLVEALEALGETDAIGMVPGLSYKPGEHLGIVKVFVVQYADGEFQTLERSVRIPDAIC